MSDISYYVIQLLSETFEPPYAYLSTVTEEDLVGRGNIVEDTKTMLSIYNKCLNYWVSAVIHVATTQSVPRTSLQELLSTSSQIPNIAQNPQSDNINLTEYAERFITFIQKEKHNIIPYNVFPRNGQEKKLQDTITFLNHIAMIKDGKNCFIPQYIIKNVKSRYTSRTVVRCASNP